MPIEIRTRLLHSTAKLPHTWSEHAVGLDLHAFLLTVEGRPNTAIIGPRDTKAIPTGIAVEAPSGYCITVWSRSGLAKRSVFVANSPGLIDPDYRGEIVVLLYNGGYESAFIKHEDRIAQLVAIPYTAAHCVEAASLSDRSRSGELGTDNAIC